ncbi:hypothetical protein [Lyticum sinuosum]|uniref:Uncharacterized protein n=1 Tax=Lyticum sinuosum TaxID=1332059 RepID=A0AAE5AHQ1_9RICK|nr:hypothetical protein [Lyticum sinuosum]MDZ5761236.1 hypothetical protein [Lyticum sinuosum]
MNINKYLNNSNKICQTLEEAIKNCKKALMFFIVDILFDEYNDIGHQIIGADIMKNDIIEIYQVRKDGTLIVIINNFKKIVINKEFINNILVCDAIL